MRGVFFVNSPTPRMGEGLFYPCKKSVFRPIYPSPKRNILRVIALEDTSPVSGLRPGHRRPKMETTLLGTFLRLIVPIGATLFGVWLLRRVDAWWQADVLKQATHVGRENIPLQFLNCWDVHDCSPERRAKCPAYLHPNLPCWEAHQVNGQLQEACWGCAFHNLKTTAIAQPVQ